MMENVSHPTDVFIPDFELILLVTFLPFCGTLTSITVLACPPLSAKPTTSIIALESLFIQLN